MKECIESIKWKCKMKEWGEIYHPDLGQYVMTYYPEGQKPYDTITDLFIDADGGLYYYKYDHDLGGWDDDLQYLCSKDEYEDVKEIEFY